MKEVGSDEEVSEHRYAGRQGSAEGEGGWEATEDEPIEESVL